MTDLMTGVRERAQAQLHGAQRPSFALRALACLVVVGALVETSSSGMEHLWVALGFATLIAAGELLRVTYPSGRPQAPLALAGGLAYALMCSLPEDYVGRSAGQPIAVSAVAMAVGAIPHAVAGRRVGVDGVAQRILVVAAVALVHCHGPAVWLLAGDRRVDLQLQALVMTGALLVAFAVDRAVMAVLMLGRGGTSFVRQFVNECKVAPGIALSVGVTAIELAIASQIMAGPWAIPLFSIPLLLTQASYRRYHGARKTYAQTIEALSKATELAGYTTLGHARRVADLSLSLGRTLDLGPQPLNALEQAALLHDLGQMSLPHPIPGGVTATLPRPQQRELASAGARLIGEAEVPGHIADIVKRQFDGAGVAADDRRSAPALASRIIAVANAYDDFKHGLGRASTDHEVVEAISSRAGTDFDPLVVQALIGGLAVGTRTNNNPHLTAAPQGS